jgi:TolA-binding protein
MKPILAVLLFLFLLSGCEHSTSETQSHQLVKQLEDSKKEIDNLKLQLTQKDNSIQLIKAQQDIKEIENKQIEDQINELYYLKKKIKKITELSSFEYVIVSDSINRTPYDIVVYVKNVPQSIDDREIYLLKASLIFGDKFKIISLWDDYQKAKLYVSGKFDAEESLFGWSGFDSKFGLINNSTEKPTLKQYFSRDDGAILEFGKYESR